MSQLVRRNHHSIWDPFQDLTSLQREMNKLISSFGGEWVGRDVPLIDDGWAAPLNISETKDQFVVKTELPGVDPKAIEVSVIKDVLTVKAERRETTNEHDERYLRRELLSGTFHRQVTLPQAIKSDGLTATYRDGILEIRLPKREEDQPKRITVDVK